MQDVTIFFAALTLTALLICCLRPIAHRFGLMDMGDAGSMSLGLLLTWFAVELTGYKSSQIPPIIAVWVLALPLIDMACLMVRRIRRGVSPFLADREHLHHVLLLAGHSVEQTVAIKAGISLLMGGIGVIAWIQHVPEYVMFYAFMVILAIYYYVMGAVIKKVSVRAREFL